jgi:endonuclease I
MKKKIIILILIFISISLFADIPDGYYDSAIGLTGEDLKAALHSIIDDHIEFPYTSSGTDTWDILKESDQAPDSPDSVVCLYTGWYFNAEDEYNNGQGWSREHVWAKSHGDFGTSMGAGTDVHHLRPCDVSVNSARSNKDFDNGGDEYYDSGIPTGCYSTTYTWEPRDEVKGDVARMIFYMAVRYKGDNGEVDLEVVDYENSSPNGEPYHGVFSTLYQWHIDDPVDDWEVNRNDVIYSYQENRNPFIDHPEFLAMIYDPVGVNEPEIQALSLKLNNYPNPFNPSTTISFDVPEGTIGELSIYSIRGRLILIKEFQAGHNEYVWNAEKFSSGIYLARLKSKSNIRIKKILLLK